MKGGLNLLYVSTVYMQDLLYLAETHEILQALLRALVLCCRHPAFPRIGGAAFGRLGPTQGVTTAGSTGVVAATRFAPQPLADRLLRDPDKPGRC